MLATAGGTLESRLENKTETSDCDCCKVSHRQSELRYCCLVASRDVQLVARIREVLRQTNGREVDDSVACRRFKKVGSATREPGWLTGSAE